MCRNHIMISKGSHMGIDGQSDGPYASTEAHSTKTLTFKQCVQSKADSLMENNSRLMEKTIYVNKHLY